MLVVSYDISDNKLRTKFAKMLTKTGGVRLQYSVFEINNTKRIQDLLHLKIENEFKKRFDGSDSIFIFETELRTAVKYGNAIHRDQDLVFFD